MFIGIFWGGFNQHRLNLKILDILRMYAEKGIEPPPAVMEQLTKQLSPPKAEQAKQSATKAGVLLGKFVGGITAAGLTGGVAWWWFAEAREPEWIGYAAVVVTIGAVAGAVSQLIAAIVTPEK
jgi:hypothetical protein